MRISELIRDLETHQDLFGDVEIKFAMKSPLYNLKEIKFHDDETCMLYMDDIIDDKVKYVKLSYPVDTVEDEDYNGVREFIDPVTKLFTITVNCETGQISGWDVNVCHAISIYDKPRDEFKISLYNKDGYKIGEYAGYVPNKFIPPLDGYGDYVCLDIDNNGVITNWYKNVMWSEFLNMCNY